MPPEFVGDYLRAFDDLLTEHGLTAMPYGHLADGCVHARIDFPLQRPDGPRRYRAFVEDGARLVAQYGGTLSGEHGDGRARSELLPMMYSPSAIDLFRAVKAVFDPAGLLNPGILVDPDPLDAGFRIGPSTRRPRRLAFAYAADGGDVGRAVERCTGVGRCRIPDPDGDAVMCPSYVATREEKDSTRGRARVLQDAVTGRLDAGWRSPAVAEALDLCLACKGCLRDCPTGVDMATYKAEALYQRYRRRLRPRSHYTLGWLPRWARLAARAPGVANAALSAPVVGQLARSAAGVDRRRSLPTFAEQTFRAWFEAEPAAPGGGRPVVVFADTFTDAFAPTVGAAVVRTLRRAGYAPTLSPSGACCALTWISTGQLAAARRILQQTTAALDDAVAAGAPIVGAEPSCTAVLRHDAPELLGSAAARRVAGATRTLAELLADTPGWTPPDLGGEAIVAQPHCHHHAVMGWDADAALLARAGARVERVGGCCGLAGNFGVESGRFDISAAIARTQLLPAVEAHPDADVLADGFSCRTQLADLANRPARHLAELLDDASSRDR